MKKKVLTGTDQYHYEERFIGATQKHQIFIWDKDKGLKSIEYINFESKKNKRGWLNERVLYYIFINLCNIFYLCVA